MTDAKDDTYDYIVIGGGTSGSAAARRLAESDDNFSVCILEAGPKFVSLLKCQLKYLTQRILCNSNKDVINSQCLAVGQCCKKLHLIGVTKLFLKKD